MKGVLLMYDQIVTLISSVGFPIVVAGYCLVTLNNTMVKMTDAINSLTAMVERGEENAD